MEQQFWVDSWDEGGTKTSFHLRDVHEHAAMLASQGVLDGARVLVPLCGKSVDLPYFARYAREVIGVELVPRAVTEFFDETGLTPVEGPSGVFTAGNLTIHCADLFALTPAALGPIDVVYDRASLIAFPPDMRDRYVTALTALTRPGTRYWINTLEYRPALPSPPFSVGPADIEAYFGAAFDIDHVRRDPRPGHRMVEKFALDFLIEHGFMLHRR